MGCVACSLNGVAGPDVGAKTREKPGSERCRPLPGGCQGGDGPAGSSGHLGGPGAEAAVVRRGM